MNGHDDVFHPGLLSMSYLSRHLLTIACFSTQIHLDDKGHSLIGVVSVRGVIHALDVHGVPVVQIQVSTHFV